MAAIAYWVDGDAGSDSNAGTTFDAAFATMGKALTEIDGDADGSTFTLNVVNSASYEMDATPTDVDVDGHPNSTLLVQGVSDSAATKALVTVTAPATGACQFATIKEVSSTVIQGFDVSFIPSVADAALQRFIAFDDGSRGTVVVQDCRLRGSALGGAFAAGTRRVFGRTGAFSAGRLEVRYCVIENMDQLVESGGSGTQSTYLHHNVIILDTSSAVVDIGALIPNAPASANNDNRIYNNTVYVEATAAAIQGFIDHNGTSGDMGRMDLYNNVLWYNTTNAAPMPEGFIGGASGGTFSTGTIGYNIFYTGADITAAEAGDSYDAAPWSPPYTGDVEQYQKADTILFTDPAGTTNWGASGIGYSLALAKNLHLLLHTDAGLNGAIPGALDDATGVDPGDGSPNNPENAQFLDVAPIFSTDLKSSLNMRILSKKNRLQRHYIRSDREDERWREASYRLINLATNTTMQVNMGGIATGDILALESDVDIEVSLGVANQFVPAKVMFLSGGSFTELWIKNTSTTAAAVVRIGVRD